MPKSFSFIKIKSIIYLSLILGFLLVSFFPQHIAFTFREIGFFLGNFGRFKEAQLMLYISKILYPKDAKTYYLLGTSFVMSGDVENALIELKKAIEIDNTLAPAYNNLGFCYLKLNQPREAIKYFNKAIEYDKKMIQSYYGLGRAYKMLKQYDLALKKINEGLKIDPTSDYLLVLKSSILVIHFNDIQKAEDLCLKALKFHPNSEYAKRWLKYIQYIKKTNLHNNKI